MNIRILHHTTTMSAPLLRLRLARRRIVLHWRESEWMQVAAMMLFILAVLLAPIVYVFEAVW